MQEALNELLSLGASLSSKLSTGFPLISARTMIKNRYGELEEEVLKFLDNPNFTANDKLQNLVKLNEYFIQLKKDLAEYDLGLEERNQKIWDSIIQKIDTTNFIIQASRVPNLHNLISDIFIREYDITVLEDVNPFSESKKWYEIVSQAMWHGSFNLKILYQSPFFSKEQFSRIFGLSMYYFKSIDSIFDDDEIKKFLTDANSNEIRDDLIRDLMIFYVNMISGLAFLQYKVEFLEYEEYLGYWEFDLDGFNFIGGLISRFQSMKTSLSTLLRSAGITGDCIALLKGEHKAVYNEFKDLEMVVLSQKLLNLLHEISPPYADHKGIIDQMDSVMTKIEKLISEIPEIVFKRENVNVYTVLFSYILSIIKQIEYLPFKSSQLQAKLEWASRLMQNTQITSMKFPFFISPILLSIDANLKKGDLGSLENDLMSLKSLHSAEVKFDPYPHLSTEILFNILKLVTNHSNLDDTINMIFQNYLSNSAFISSSRLLEQIENFIDYLREYKKSIEENQKKPILPLELEQMNTALPLNHVFRHIPSLEFYSIKGKYMELKYPIFGDPSFTIFDK